MNFHERLYEKWLGLDLDDPDHFALLRIEPEESDPDRIKRAAKDALKKLGKEPTSPDEIDSWKQVRRRVKAAYQCLTDEITRAAYLDQLTLRAEMKVSLPDDEDPQDTSTSLDTVTDELRAELLDRDKSLETAREEIPVAVPMAEVVDEQLEQTAAVAVATDKVKAPVVQAEPPRRRSRKSVWPLTLLVLLAVGGGFAIWHFVVKPRLNEPTAQESRFKTQPHNPQTQTPAKVSATMRSHSGYESSKTLPNTNSMTR